MENINRIAESLRKGFYTTNPHGAAEDLAILAGEYAYALSQLEAILQKKPAIWNELRKNFKSDTACERGWEAMPDGILESSLHLRAKSIEKMMSALKSVLRLAENETRNLM